MEKNTIRAVRCYMEIYGTLKDINKTEDGKLVWDRVLNEGKYKTLTNEVLDYMAKALGFSKYEDIPVVNPNKLGEPVEHKEYVELLSAFLQNSQGISIHFNGALTPISEILFALSNIDKEAQFNKFITNATFKKAMKSIMPKWTKSDVKDPMINLGNLYYNNDSLGVKERNAIEKEAIKDACLHSLTLSTDLRFLAVSMLNKRCDIITLAEQSPEVYRDLLCLTHKAGFTVKELIELLNYNHINCIEQLRIFNFTVTAHTKSSVKITDDTSFVILNNDDFKMLYEIGILKSLHWCGKIPYVKNGKALPLGRVLGKGTNSNDLR